MAKDLVTNLLNSHQAQFSIYEHAPDFVSQQKVLGEHGLELRNGIKAMVFKQTKEAGDSSFIMIAVPADKRVDLAKVKAILSCKKLDLATPEELHKVTKLLPGEVPPFAQLFNLKMLADKTIFDNKIVALNAADKGVTVTLDSDVFKQINQPEIGEFAK